MKATNARDEILSAADRLFGEQGFENASTRHIAELSGVNKALIHYHFKNKDALFEAVLDRYYQRLNTLLLETLTRPGNLRDRLHRLIEVYSSFLAENHNFSRIVQRESAGGRHFDRIRDHLVPTFKAALEMMQKEFPNSRGGDLAAYQLLISFYGMIIGYFTFSDMVAHLVGRDPLSAEELSARGRHLKRMADIALDALVAPAAPADTPHLVNKDRKVKGGST